MLTEGQVLKTEGGIGLAWGEGGAEERTWQFSKPLYMDTGQFPVNKATEKLNMQFSGLLP